MVLVLQLFCHSPTILLSGNIIYPVCWQCVCLGFCSNAGLLPLWRHRPIVWRIINNIMVSCKNRNLLCWCWLPNYCGQRKIGFTWGRKRRFPLTSGAGAQAGYRCIPRAKGIPSGLLYVKYGLRWHCGCYIARILAGSQFAFRISSQWVVPNRKADRTHHFATFMDIAGFSYWLAGFSQEHKTSLNKSGHNTRLAGDIEIQFPAGMEGIYNNRLWRYMWVTKTCWILLKGAIHLLQK